MAADRERPASYRPRVAVVMFLVLLASVGAAGALVYLRTLRPEQRGREILARLRDGGLEEAWGKDGGEIWLLGEDASGRPVGAIYIEWRPTEQGYAGRRIRTAYDTGGRVKLVHEDERWSLSPEGKLTDYKAMLIDNRARDPFRQRLQLDGGKLEVEVAWTGSTPETASTQLPPDAVPMAFLPRLAGASVGEAKAAVHMPAYATPLRGDAVLTRVTVSPVNERTATVGYLALGVHVRKATYEFDEQGDLESVETAEPDVRYTPQTDLRVFTVFRDEIGQMAVQRLRERKTPRTMPAGGIFTLLLRGVPGR